MGCWSCLIFSCIIEGKIIVSWHDMIVSSHDTVVSSCAVIAEYVKGGVRIRMPTVSFIYMFLRWFFVRPSFILRCELDHPPL